MRISWRIVATMEEEEQVEEVVVWVEEGLGVSYLRSGSTTLAGLNQKAF